jgi:hypothetical protein
MRTRKSSPLWVGLTFGLIFEGKATYLTGYLIFEYLLALFR